MKKIVCAVWASIMLVSCGSSNIPPSPLKKNNLHVGLFNEKTIDSFDLTEEKLVGSKVNSKNEFTLTRYSSSDESYGRENGIHLFYRNQVDMPAGAKAIIKSCTYNDYRFAPVSVVARYGLEKRQKSQPGYTEQDSISLMYNLVPSQKFLILLDLIHEEREIIGEAFEGNAGIGLKNGYIINRVERHNAQTNITRTYIQYLIRDDNKKLRFVNKNTKLNAGGYMIDVLKKKDMPEYISEYVIDKKGYARDFAGNYFVKEFDTHIISTVPESQIWLDEIRYREFLNPIQGKKGEW